MSDLVVPLDENTDEYDIKFQQEKDCQERFQNVTLGPGPYCKAARDSITCWPPTQAGEVAVQSCSAILSSSTLVKEGSITGPVAFRVCAPNGEWLWGNWTNYSECFSLLEELSDVPIIVGYIVLVCSAISVITLALTLFIFCHFKSLQCSRLQVHRNLSVALMIHTLLLIVLCSPVMFGDVLPSYRQLPWLCKTVLALKMYSAMASINWMFLEGLLLHSRVTVSIFKQDAPFKMYYCIGWGLPAVLITTWSVLMSNDLNTVCWQSYGESPYIWIITGPMMAALLVNSVFLVNIIRVLMTRHRVNVSVETAQVGKAIKATGLLFPLLGITHLLFCINPSDDGQLEEAYMIINAFLQSSQGLFVSVLYCFMNTDVQKALRNAYLRRAIRRNPNHRYRGRGMSQTSGTYMSHSEGLLDNGRAKPPSPRTVITLQEVDVTKTRLGKKANARIPPDSPPTF